MRSGRTIRPPVKRRLDAEASSKLMTALNHESDSKSHDVTSLVLLTHHRDICSGVPLWAPHSCRSDAKRGAPTEGRHYKLGHHWTLAQLDRCFSGKVLLIDV